MTGLAFFIHSEMSGSAAQMERSSSTNTFSGIIPGVTIVARAKSASVVQVDIAADAYRRELLPEAEFGLGNSIYVNAYRISSLVPGSLALILADRMPWSSVFTITALFMLPGLAYSAMRSS